MSHVKFEFHPNRDTLTDFTAQNRSKYFFLHSWPQKLYQGLRLGTHTYIVSVLTPTDFRHGWAIFGPLVDKNTQKRELVELPVSEKFCGLLCTCFEISTWNLVYTSSSSATYRVIVSSQSGHADLLYCQNVSKSFFLHLWPQQLYETFRFGTHTYIASVLNCIDFCHGWAIFGPLVATKTQKGDLSRTSSHRGFFIFFSTCFDFWTWNLLHTSGRWHDTWGLSFITIRSRPLESWKVFQTFFFEVWIWKLVYTLSRLHNILISRFTRMESLWRTSCS